MSCSLRFPQAEIESKILNLPGNVFNINLIFLDLKKCLLEKLNQTVLSMFSESNQTELIVVNRLLFGLVSHCT